MRLRRSTAPRPPPRQRPLLEELEPRILFSADAVAGLLDVNQLDVPAQVRLLEPVPVAPEPATGTEAVQQSRHEIVFVDTRVADYQVLLDDLLGQNNDSRQIEVFVLDPNQDGIEQISQALAQRHDIDALHLISHGADGEVQLGDTYLNFDSLRNQAEQIQRWSDALTADADLLIYGCDVAQQADGKALVDALAQLTGADVAASIDLTGSARLGGDWNLEYQIGRIETSVVGDQLTQAEWQGLLAISQNSTSVSSDTSNVTSLTWSHTVHNGSDRALFVGLSIDSGATATEVKYGTESLTLVGRFSDANGTVELWQLLAPALGTSNITATISSNVKVMGGAVTFNGVDQTTPTSGTFTGTAGSSTTPSHTVSSATDDLVLGVLWMNGGTATEGTGQTNLWGLGSDGAIGLPQGEGSTKPGAASVILSWTLTPTDRWVAGGISIHATVNNAPALSGSNALNAIDEDAASNPGTLVSALIAGQVSDADSGALSGIAVTAVDSSDGTWQYTTNGGTTWNAFGTPSESIARLLAADANTSVRFVPNANWNGSVATGITFRAWDQSSGTAGDTADTTSNGGTSAFSSATASAGITVNAVNDAPQGSDNTVTTLEDTSYTFTAADFGFSDPNDSSPNSLAAVRISSAPGAGTLTNNAVPVSAGQTITVADINAGKLKFVPAANASGTGYASFTFQVQDDGGTANGGVNLDATPNTLTINVTAVNNAPAGTNTLVTTLEDTPYTFSAADFGFSDPNDSPANGLLAVKITTLPGAGTLTNGATALSGGDVVSVADINANQLKFTPVANANGAGYASFTFQVQDDGGTLNGGVDLDPTPSTLTINVTAVNDGPTGLPTVSGTPTEDQTLTADASAINDIDGLGTFSYQWQRNGANITGATTATYALVDADVGAAIRVQLSYIDGGGTAESLVSAQTAAVANVNDAPLGQPAVKGTATVDQTLTADTTGITDADGLGAFSYQWLRDGAVLSGATGDSYTLGTADVGGRISVEVRYTDAHGTAEGPIASAQTSAVSEALPATEGNDLAGGLAPAAGSGSGADVPLAEAIAAASSEPAPPPAPAAANSDHADAQAERDFAMEDSLTARVAVLDTVVAERAVVAAPVSAEDAQSGRQGSVSSTAHLTAVPEWMAAQFPQFAELGGAPAADFSPLASLSQLGAGSAQKAETLVRDLDELRETVKDGVGIEKYTLSSAVAVSTGLSVGYAAWLVRGGVLLSTLLSSMPAWRVLDPFPVLARQRDPDEDDDDDSLESMVDDDGSVEEPIVSDESRSHGEFGDRNDLGASEPAPRS